MRVFFLTKFYFTERQNFAGYSPKYMEVKCLGQVMRSHKIQVEKISWLPLIRLLSITFDSYLLCIKLGSLTCSLRCIIPAYCICLAKQNF